MNQTLDGKICLVTGASRGIGRAIAEALGAEGGVVIGTATSEAGAAAIDDYLREKKIAGGGRVLDVTDDESVAELMAGIMDQFGAPNVLVNNAGITRDNLLIRMKDDEWNDIINTNLNSVFRLSKIGLRAMLKAKNGRIINIASLVGVAGNAGQANYAAAKAGMIGFTKSLAREVAARNVTVNAIAPGFIKTDMTDALPDAAREAMLAQIPAGRLGTPSEVAAAVVFLAGDAAAYITGATLHINGGMLMV